MIRYTSVEIRMEGQPSPRALECVPVKLKPLVGVMAGLVPAIHVSLLLVVCKQDVDARDERGHDESGGFTMMDLELLRSFVSVVDAGGFTRAGGRVHRTQATVSQQIRRLEES